MPGTGKVTTSICTTDKVIHALLVKDYVTVAMPGTEKWQHLYVNLRRHSCATCSEYVTVAMPGTEKVTSIRKLTTSFLRCLLRTRCHGNAWNWKVTTIRKLTTSFLRYLLRLRYRGDAWNWKVTTSIRKLTTSFLCCLLRIRYLGDA